MYESIVLAVWHLDPIATVEETWTDDFFNMMIYQFLARVSTMAKAVENISGDIESDTPEKGSMQERVAGVINSSMVPADPYPKELLASSKKGKE